MDESAFPRVSVALCTFNGQEFIAEQLRSILAQTRPAAELVIADDGSTDGTLDIVEATLADERARHPEAAPRVVVLRGDAPLGVAANFERALRACTADLIALSDQDDVWDPERLATLVAVFADAPEVALVHSNARLIDADGRDLGITLFQALGVRQVERDEIARGDAVDAYLRRNLATGATTMLRTGVRDAALPIPDGWIHDEWLAMVAAATARTALVETSLTGYRQHGANQIGARRPTIGDRLSRLREPRGARNARLLVRARSLAERLDALPGVDDATRSAVHEKLAHETRRSALPAARIRRVGPVLAAARRGDYARFGNGAQDVLRDLVQPGSAGSA